MKRIGEHNRARDRKAKPHCPLTKPGECRNLTLARQSGFGDPSSELGNLSAIHPVRLYITHSPANVWRRDSAGYSLLKPCAAFDMRTLDCEYSAADKCRGAANQSGIYIEEKSPCQRSIRMLTWWNQSIPGTISIRPIKSIAR